MPTRVRLLVLTCLAAVPSLMVFAACSSDDTTSGSSSSSSSSSGGNGDGGKTNITGDGSDGTFALTSLDDVCDGGPSGRQLLAFVPAALAGTFTPPTTRKTPPWAGATSPSALTITARYANGKILCTPHREFNCPPGAPCAAPPPPQIQVELEMTFTTSDGLLTESFVATARYESNFNQVGFRADLPATKIKGTYPIAAGTPDEVRLNFVGSFEGSAATKATLGNISELTSKISFSGGQWTASPSDAGASDASTKD